MRELRFEVIGQKIRKDKSCSFSGIVQGTQGYLTASFSFSHEWSGMTKVAVFKCLGKEYPARLESDKCAIPDGALKWRSWSVYVVGQKKGMRLTTKSETVEQEVY